MDFETVIKTIVLSSFALILPVGGYVAVRMAMVWVRRHEHDAQLPAGAAADEETLARLAQLEAEVAELQGRVDFSERILAQVRSEPRRIAEAP